jgi:uncharacterized coiled-coil protein SlyX
VEFVDPKALAAARREPACGKSMQAAAGACMALLLACAVEPASAQSVDDPTARLEALKQQVADQAAKLEALKRQVADQESSLNQLRRALGSEALASQRGGTAAPGTAAAAPGSPEQVSQAETPAASANPVGQAPERGSRAPEVATIFEQPGVLTGRGKWVLEPSLQYSYSSSNRVALVGYTIIPAIHIGVIDVREVKRNTFVGALTARYGVTNRFEVEAKLPYVYRSDASVGREINADPPLSNVFDASGRNIGDVEFAARYQLNDGGVDKPYYVGSLRLKTRTGSDPFESPVLNNIQGLRSGVYTKLPTGSGFVALQPALTTLYPSDPAVFFGTVSYLYSFKRDNVYQQQLNDAPAPLGSVQPGGVFGFNFGMGLSLNERSSFSIGYDHASVGRTKQNGQPQADSVRVQLGTLLLGYSYRLDSKLSLNVSLGAGLTRDTPDVTLTLRVPTSF